MRTSAGTRVTLAALALLVTPFCSPAQADSDACAFLTPAQVSAAAGFQVGTGTHVTPTFLQTCTWTGSAGGVVQFVTLNLQAGTFFDGAKRQATMMAAAGAGVKSAGIGEDSFYLVQGTQVMLWVKKGASAFKVTVYKQIPSDQKETMEGAMAKLIVAKL